MEAREDTRCRQGREEEEEENLSSGRGLGLSFSENVSDKHFRKATLPNLARTERTGSRKEIPIKPWMRWTFHKQGEGRAGEKEQEGSTVAADMVAALTVDRSLVPSTHASQVAHNHASFS